MLAKIKPQAKHLAWCKVKNRLYDDSGQDFKLRRPVHTLSRPEAVTRNDRMRRSKVNRWQQRLPPLAGMLALLCGGTLLRAQSSVAPMSVGEAPGLSTSAAAALAKASAGLSADAVADALPDAPSPQTTTKPLERQRQATTPGFPPVSPAPGPRLPQPGKAHPEIPSMPSVCLANLSLATPDDLCCARKYDSFERFLNSSDIHPLSVRQKGILAFRNSIDPYNFATIAANSAIAVASDPSSPYGPGLPGFGRNFGVSYTENAVSEFFGTFLIPAVTHQDPHYHRLPNASYSRRILHAITQVAWAQDDYGKPVPNYSVLVGTAIGDVLGNLYVPGRNQDPSATASRYVTAIATDPIGNFITEFVPDVARRVNVRIVLVQRVIDRVERGQ
jgi:hypothetical protein